MSYHIVPNDSTSVELMPFSALEENQQVEDYAYRQQSRMNDPYHAFYNTRRGNFSETWQDISYGCTRRWHLLSRRRQRRLQIVTVLSGVLLIVIALEAGVKTIYHKHVKAAPPVIDDWDDLEEGDLYAAAHAHHYNEDGQEKVIQDYDVPVNRVLCEQIVPLFRILDDSLDHACYQRNKMRCDNHNDGDDTKLVYYERDGVFYNANGSRADPAPALVECGPYETEVWSPLSPFHPSYDEACLHAEATAPNRFCNANNEIDWNKVQELMPKCMLSTNIESCNDLSSKIFKEVMGGHLNCWEFQIAFMYVENQVHDTEDGTLVVGGNVCKGQNR